MLNKCYIGDCQEGMRLFAIDGLRPQMCVTSPPYWGLRDYGHEGAYGLEDSPAAYLERMVSVFRSVRDLLADDGTLWINMGDSYYSPRVSGATGDNSTINGKGTQEAFKDAQCARNSQVQQSNMASSHSVAMNRRRGIDGMKPKDLVGMPWQLALALRDDGWYLRQDIIWCLSGGVWLYARTQKGDMPIMVRDLARIDPATVKLWNGEKWTQLCGMSGNKRRGNEIEFVLRSGERISCTPTHRFPTDRGLLIASEIHEGDTLISTTLPEPDQPRDCALDEDAAWFAGLYLAEGSRSGGTIQIAGHVNELDRWRRVQQIAVKFGGSATKTDSGNSQSIRVYGRVLRAIIDELVTGRIAKDKGFSPVVWKYSNSFIDAMLDGYLSGDGHHDVENHRWRLGFTRNYNLERDLRTACARLGYMLTLNLSTVQYGGRAVPTFRGEIRKVRRGHFNERDRAEVIEVRKSRCRMVYDLGVEDEPHAFALASGILTHNSKPNPMPESVKDRCTKAHEYLFLLAKSERYFYDFEAMQEPVSGTANARGNGVNPKSAKWKTPDGWDTRKGEGGHGSFHSEGREKGHVRPRQNESFSGAVSGLVEKRNRRSVWTVQREPYPDAHFATYPRALIEPCILAGSRPGDIVLDPFMGSGTTAQVAEQLGRKWLGCEINPEYVDLQANRLRQRHLELDR